MRERGRETAIAGASGGGGGDANRPRCCSPSSPPSLSGISGVNIVTFSEHGVELAREDRNGRSESAAWESRRAREKKREA